MTRTDRGAGSAVVVGRIVRCRGVGGEVLVRVESDHPDRFTPPAYFRADRGPADLLVLLEARSSPKGLIARFAGITTRQAASELVGADLLIEADERGPLQPDEFWPDQLIDLEVRIGSEQAGRVDDVILGPQDRLAVSLRSGAAVEVPFVAALVPEVDLAGGWLRIDPPRGLLDLFEEGGDAEAGGEQDA